MAGNTLGGDKAELIAQLDRARAQFGQSLDALRRDADIGAHLKHSFAAHRTAWISSAGIAGWVLSRLAGRKQKVIVRKKEEEEVKHIAFAGLLLGILKTLFTLFRPFIIGFARKKIADVAAKNNHWKK